MYGCKDINKKKTMKYVLFSLSTFIEDIVEAMSLESFKDPEI